MSTKCNRLGCFANRNEKCGSLKYSDFGGLPCPFYKSRLETTMKQINAECKKYSIDGYRGKAW